jgi:GT2 family glycosyltransferase
VDTLVSIVINNFNYARYLPHAIDSALAQTHRPTQVIVVDDGSTDDSRPVIDRYAGRIRPVLKTNGGQASARAGVSIAAAPGAHPVPRRDHGRGWPPDGQHRAAALSEHAQR